MNPAIISAIIGGIFSVICALIARSKGPTLPPAKVGEAPIRYSSYPWSPARWLSWVAAVAWIIPLFGFPFALLTIGYAYRDSKAEVGRQVPAYVMPVAVISLVLTVLNAIWGGYQAAHGCQFYQPASGCHQ
jgi:hypothetical protein